MPGIKTILAIGAGLVRTAHAQAPALPLLAPMADLVIDGAKNDFSKVTAIAADTRGSIYVADRGDQRILVFDSLGKPVRTLGRKGGGPGEFKAIRALGFVGDSLWVADWGDDPRLTVFRPDGRLIRTKSVAAIKPSRVNGALTRRYINPLVHAVYSDGSVLVAGISLHGDPGIQAPGSRPLIRTAATGEVIQFVSARPPSPDRVSMTEGSLRGTAALPFSIEPKDHTAVDGSAIVEARAIATGDDSGFIRVVVIQQNGDTAYTRTYRTSTEPIPERVLDSAVEATVAILAKSGEGGRAMVELLRRAPRARFYPTLRDAKIARDASVLLCFTTSGSAAGDKRDYMILDPAGNAKARFTLPKSLEVMQFETDRLWGTITDSDGFPSIVRYRLAPGAK